MKGPTSSSPAAAGTRTPPATRQFDDLLLPAAKSVFTREALHEVLSEEFRAALAHGARPHAPGLRDKLTRCAGPLERRLCVDLHEYLPSDLLMKTDRMTMLASLEARVPFLNHPFVETAWAVPSNLKLRDGIRKYALKHLARGRLPDEIIARPKKGFSIPMDVWLWMKGTFRDMVYDTLLAPRTRARGLFNFPRVASMLDEHDRLRGLHGYRLWTLFVFEVWQRNFVDGAGDGDSLTGMSAPLTVSVIMPAFNAATYIREAVDSVLAQRFEAFELLVADDGSTDDTRAILDGYQQHHACPRPPQSAQHRRRAATRNRLIAQARGRYITPCDADDIMLPGNLRCLSTFLDEHMDVGVVYGDLLSLRLGPNDELVEPPTICGADCNKTWDLFENVVNHGGSMSRRDILIESGGYDEQVASVDDWSLWLRVAERTRIHYLRGGLYYVWRRHVRSMTRTDARAQADTRRIVAEASIRRGFK